MVNKEGTAIENLDDHNYEVQENGDSNDDIDGYGIKYERDQHCTNLLK